MVAPSSSVPWHTVLRAVAIRLFGAEGSCKASKHLCRPGQPFCTSTEYSEKGGHPPPRASVKGTRIQALCSRDGCSIWVLIGCEAGCAGEGLRVPQHGLSRQGLRSLSSGLWPAWGPSGPLASLPVRAIGPSRSSATLGGLKPALVAPSAKCIELT